MTMSAVLLGHVADAVREIFIIFRCFMCAQTFDIRHTTMTTPSACSLPLDRMLAYLRWTLTHTDGGTGDLSQRHDMNNANGYAARPLPPYCSQRS